MARPKVLGALGMLVLFVCLLVFAFAPVSHRSSFRGFICSPVPESVQGIRYQDNGRLGLLLEPVVWIRFSAASEDMKRVVEERRAKLVPPEDEGLFASRTGPAWWWARPLNDGSQLYRFRGNHKGITGKRGIEWLRIDATGTNAFYLLWGI